MAGTWGEGGIELLAPARDLDCGRAAIDCGADAVYIGAARFGARARAGNSVEDIAALVEYAHRYWARVYVTVNTLLRDDEIPQAVDLITRLYEIEVDAAIVQDVGLLECDLPPIALVASTQMHNHTPERVAFLEQVGFQRVILARELDLSQIAAIRRQTSIELESFVHGALCVSYSGQCYMSYAIGGRSGNRGECAQPCRRRYSLIDGEGQVLVEDRHLLSLRDLDLSEHLGEMIDAGIRSFKIEGRLKDRAYVTNVVSFFRQRLDLVLEERGLPRSSSGHSRAEFMPDLAKTFNRGYTTYFLHGRGASPGALDTPKMKGEYLGRVSAARRGSFTLDARVDLHPGDGLAFLDAWGTLRGTTVHRVQDRTVAPDRMSAIVPGTRIYRNRDHAFLRDLERKGCAERKIPVRFSVAEQEGVLVLEAADEDGNVARVAWSEPAEPAQKPKRAREVIDAQLHKTGGTPFECVEVAFAWSQARFLPLSAINQLRREVLSALLQARIQCRPLWRRTPDPGTALFPARRLDYTGNVLNRWAEAFYRRHGVQEIDRAPEAGMDMRGEVVMRTRYCIKQQLGWCPRDLPHDPPPEPLSLVDEDGHCYRLEFDCAACEMVVRY